MDFTLILLAIMAIILILAVGAITISVFLLFSLFKRAKDIDQDAYLPDLFPKDKVFCNICGDNDEWCDSC